MNGLLVFGRVGEYLSPERSQHVSTHQFEHFVQQWMFVTFGMRFAAVSSPNYHLVSGKPRSLHLGIKNSSDRITTNTVAKLQSRYTYVVL